MFSLSMHGTSGVSNSTFHDVNYRKFVCKKCTVIPDYFQEMFHNEVPTTTAPHSEILEFKTALSQKTTEMQVIAESNRKLAAKVNELHKELEKKVVRSKKGNEEHTKLKAEAKKLKNGILTYEEKINNLNSTIADRESELKELHVNSIVEIPDDNTLVQLQEIMTTKLELVERNLTESLLAEVTKNNRKLEEKLDEIMKEYKSYTETVSQSHIATNAAPQTTESPDLCKIMRDEQNAQLAEETDIKPRSCNTLMHRVAESTIGDKHQAKQRDEEYVSNFLQTLGVNKEYKANRLG